MAGRDAVVHSEPGRADGDIRQILQLVIFVSIQNSKLWTRRTRGLLCSFLNKASGTFNGYPIFQSEMNDDYLYGDPGYSWDEHIQA
jgi:hypothetical protein